MEWYRIMLPEQDTHQVILSSQAFLRTGNVMEPGHGNCPVSCEIALKLHFELSLLFEPFSSHIQYQTDSSPKQEDEENPLASPVFPGFALGLFSAGCGSLLKGRPRFNTKTKR
jgi:hypothetical protein